MASSDDEIEIVDPVYSNKSDKSSKNIILTHWEKCIQEGSKEMNIGGVQKRFINGEIVEYYAPNQIEIFINHVEMLKRALIADIEYSPKTVKNLNKFNSIRQSYINSYKRKKRELIKWYSNLSNTSNPEGYNEKDSYSDRYKKMRQYIDEFYNEKMKELYEEQLFPYLNKLLSERQYLTN